MQAEDKRRVKIRVNASGNRIIGYVYLAPEVHRASDFLNGPDPYLVVWDEDQPLVGEGTFTAILKDAVSYVQAVEEPEAVKGLRRQGTFYTIVVQLEEPSVAIEAELFVPHERKIPEVLNDSRPFFSLRNAQLVKAPERYSYLAVGKKQSILIRLRE